VQDGKSRAQTRAGVGVRELRPARLRARGAWEQDAGGGAGLLAGVQARELLLVAGAKQQRCCGGAEAARGRVGEARSQESSVQQ